MGRYSVGIILVCLVVSAAFGDRPGKAEGATEVEFFVYVIDVDDIDGAEQNFAINVFVFLTWNDKRLACEGDMVRRLPLEGVWNPRVLIVNQQGLVRTSLPEIVEVHSDGKVTYRQRYVGRMSQPLKLSEFPFDEHDFTVHFISAGHVPDELRFVPGVPRETMGIVGGSMQEKLSLPDWRILKYQAQSRAYEPVAGAEVSGFVFEFRAKRYAAYYIWQVIAPLIFIVAMSWGGFWIDPTNAGAQIGVATSSILTLIAYRFMLGNLLPRLPYMTRLDYFTLGSTALVFLTLVEVVITTKLALSKMEVVGRRIDRWCRVVFPIAFVVWSVLSLLH
ncbi:MAG: hypothetical protein V3R81_01370 [Gammaproteobacteria bacterium]